MGDYGKKHEELWRTITDLFSADYLKMLCELDASVRRAQHGVPGVLTTTTTGTVYAGKE